MTIIVQDLYGLKSAGVYLRNHLAKCMQFLTDKPFLTDPDPWMRPIKISIDGFKHYGYVLLYIDNIFAIGDDPNEVLHNFDNYLDLNPGSLANPRICLGEKVKPTRM